MFKHLHQSYAAVLVVPGQHTVAPLRFWRYSMRCWRSLTLTMCRVTTISLQKGEPGTSASSAACTFKCSAMDDIVSRPVGILVTYVFDITDGGSGKPLSLEYNKFVSDI